MKAYKCDRCGNLYERKVKPNITIYKYVPFCDTRLDLCHKCQDTLENWLNEFKPKESEQECTKS